MKIFRAILIFAVVGALCVRAVDPAFRKLERSADAVVIGQILRVEDSGKLVEVKEGVWMVKILCHLKVVEGSRALSGRTVIVERFRNITPSDRDLFDDERNYLLSMVDQPVQANLAKGDTCKALLSHSEVKSVWWPAGGFLNDGNSFSEILPST